MCNSSSESRTEIISEYGGWKSEPKARSRD